MTGNRILLRTVRRNRGRLAFGSFLIGVHQATETLVPILIGVTVDRAVATGDLTQLVIWVGALALLFLALTNAYRYGARQLVTAIAGEGHQLRLELAERIMDPRGIRTGLRSGELLSISTSDADQTSYVMDHVPRIFGALVATVISAVALILISVPLGLVVLVATPVVLIGLQLGAPLITRRVADQQHVAGLATSLATDLVSGLRPMRGIGAQDAAADRYREVSRRSLRATLRATRTQGVYLGVTTTASTLLTCAVAILAGWFALTGRISPGQFVTVIGLAQFLLEPLGTLSRLPAWIAAATASARRIALVLDAPLIRPEGTTGRVVPPAGLTLTQVRSGPLQGLDLTVRPGEFVGVVCRRPGDADQLVRLLGGHVDDWSGDIELGDGSLRELAVDDLRSVLLVEPHHSDLFTGTVRSNVVIGGSPAPADALAGALRSSAADEVVEAHPDGLDHEVTERGTSLSGGQRQRLALARALLAGPPLLVLHDPTTAVDAVTEQSIAQGIRALRHRPGSDLGTLVITSSPALLAQADRVLVVADGVVADGADAEQIYRTVVLR